MKTFILFLFFALISALLSAQTDEADMTAIRHIRSVYDSISNRSELFAPAKLEEGGNVSLRDKRIRRIVVVDKEEVRWSYYYSAAGMPLFVFRESEGAEERYYFSPQLNGPTERYEMIRWMVDREYQSSGKDDFRRKQDQVLITAFKILNRAYGELELTERSYSDILRKIQQTDEALAARQLVAKDTISYLEPEEETFGDEPTSGCMDQVITFTSPQDSARLRTVHTEGCDPGCMAYTINHELRDYDDRGHLMRVNEITESYFLSDPDGKGLVNSAFPQKISTYFEDGSAVYRLTVVTHQGYEISRRLARLKG